MLGLAIDSADRIASAALWRAVTDGGVDKADDDLGSKFANVALLAKGALPPEAGKADQLITVIETLLQDQGLDYDDLDVIAVNRGPGSFTGIRSAVALGRGLALATGLPILGVTSHEALAATLRSEPSDKPLLIALDARRGEVYVQAFAADGRPFAAIEAHAPATVAASLGTGSWRLAGHGALLVREVLDDWAKVEMIECRPVDAAAVALRAACRLSTGEMPASGFGLRPLYLRAPDAVPPAPLVLPDAHSEILA